ncbi:MAG: Ig-like domain-containing protein, partial [Bacillota bacterium]
DNITRSTVKYLDLNTEKLTLGPDDTATLIPIIQPEDILGNGAMNRELSWSSSDNSVVTVDQQGRVQAIGAGKAEITVRSNDVGRVASCTVTVLEEPISVTGITKANHTFGEEIQVKVGEDEQLKVKTQGAKSKVTWKSMNSYLADVDQKGRVTAYSSGEVDLLATTRKGGYVERYTFSISEPPVEVEAINLNKNRINLASGSNKKITATVSPANILEKKISWSSSDENVVEIREDKDTIYGAARVNLRAVDAGTAVVTASCGEKYQSCRVTVTKSTVPVNTISLESDLQIDVDQVYHLEAEVNNDATNKELVWLSTDSSIATVNQEGMIKGYKPGEIKIIALAKDSLSSEQSAVIKELQKARRINEKDRELKNKLDGLLQKDRKDSITSACCQLVVKDSSPYLRNLHAPEEAVTANSVNLLWNRASKLDTENWEAYRVYIDDKLIAVTEKLGHTVKNLNPDTTYTFTVKAVDSNDKLLADETITVTTGTESTKVINVMDEPYNAAGHGRVMDTRAIQKAINDCPPGGTVLLPAGHVFHSGALFLKSDMIFQVDGILIGSTNPKDYPLMITRWEGWRKLEQSAEEWANSTEWLPENSYAHASLLNAGVYDEGEPGKKGPYNVSNLVIRGQGQINGNGFKLGYNEGPNQKSRNGGKPVPESPKKDPTVRGRTITLHNARDVYLADLNVAYGPSWTVHPIYCDQITFDNIELVSKGTGKTGAADDITILNGDGIDPDSSTNINIFNCFFFAGDDAVAIKSGRNREGNELAKPTAYVRVTDCISDGSKGGFCIGSEQAGGAHDILWQNLTVNNINLHGLWIKANEARGGIIKDILWKDCLISEAYSVIDMQLDYHSSKTNSADRPPEICYMTFENIRGGSKNNRGIHFDGLENSYIHDIVIQGCSFDSISGDKSQAFQINYGYNFDICDVRLPDGFNWQLNNVESINITSET